MNGENTKRFGWDICLAREFYSNEIGINGLIAGI